MTCPKCGCEHDFNFCPECGLSANPGFQAPIKRKKSKIVRAFKVILFAFTGLFALFIIIDLSGGFDEDTGEAQQAAAKTTGASTSKQTKPTTTPTTLADPEVFPEDVQDMDYVLFYLNYSDSFEGQWIRISGPIFATGKDHLTIREGLGGGLTETLQAKIANADIGKLSEISSDQYVTVVGLVESKFMGLLTLENARIEEVGGNAEQAATSYAEKRQKALEEQVAEYKRNAETITYEKLIREPYNYEGKVLKITIKVSQIMTGGLLTESGYRGYASGTNNEWYINYELPDNVPRILEGDKVTFYGTFAGVVEMTRLITSTKDQVPKLTALYHD